MEEIVDREEVVEEVVDREEVVEEVVDGGEVGGEVVVWRQLLVGEIVVNGQVVEDVPREARQKKLQLLVIIPPL